MHSSTRNFGAVMMVTVRWGYLLSSHLRISWQLTIKITNGFFYQELTDFVCVWGKKIIVVRCIEEQAAWHTLLAWCPPWWQLMVQQLSIKQHISTYVNGWSISFPMELLPKVSLLKNISRKSHQRHSERRGWWWRRKDQRGGYKFFISLSLPFYAW